MKDSKVTYNPELKPKSHDLIISFWVGKKDPDNILNQDAVVAFFKSIGYRFCGSGFAFDERRRDIEFKKMVKNG